MKFLAWFEQTDFSIWVREEWWVFPLILSIHAVGMGLSAGVNFAIGLRMLGVAPGIPLSRMARFIPLVWIGFAANVVSGLALLAGYPAKALTNPVFYLKLVFIAAGLWHMKVIARDVLQHTEFESGPLPSKYKRYACFALLLWIGVITSGRFLAYTHHILLAYWDY